MAADQHILFLEEGINMSNINKIEGNRVLQAEEGRQDISKVVFK